MMNKKKKDTMLLMTKQVKKGDRIYPGKKKTPIAVAEENFNIGDIGITDKNILYPIVCRKKVLMLPGLKKKFIIKMN